MARIAVPAYEWAGETTTQRGQRPDRKIRKVRKWGAAGGGDVTAPVLQSATIAANGLSVALVYDEALDAGSVLAAGNWTLNGTSATVSSVGASGSTLTLTLGAAVGESETVTITTSASPVDDTSGNAAATLTGQATTNNSTVLLVPLLASNCLTYLHADSGPVGTPSTAVGNAVTDWVSLTDATGGGGPWDFDQSGSSDRPVIDETSFSGGRRCVLFDGTSDFMAAVGDMAGALEGDDQDHTKYLHFVSNTTSGTADLLSFCNDSGDNRDQIQRLGDDVRSLRRVTSTITSTAVDVLGIAEHTLVSIREGDTRTVWVDGVKVIDAAAEATGAITFTQVILAAVDIGAITNPSSIGLRQMGVWDVAFSDAQVAQLPAVGS